MGSVVTASLTACRAATYVILCVAACVILCVAARVILRVPTRVILLRSAIRTATCALGTWRRRSGGTPHSVSPSLRHSGRAPYLTTLSMSTLRSLGKRCHSG